MTLTSKRDAHCPDVHNDYLAGMLFSSTWLYVDDAMRILHASLLKGHGNSSPLSIQTIFQRQSPQLQLPLFLIERFMASLPSDTYLGRKRMHRIRQHLHTFRRYPCSLCKRIVVVNLHGDNGSVMSDLNRLNFECFVMVTHRNPYPHCSDRFWRDANGVRLPLVDEGSSDDGW